MVLSGEPCCECVVRIVKVPRGVGGSGDCVMHHLSVVPPLCLLMGLVGSLQGIWELFLVFDAWKPWGPEDHLWAAG